MCNNRYRTNSHVTYRDKREGLRRTIIWFLQNVRLFGETLYKLISSRADKIHIRTACATRALTAVNLQPRYSRKPFSKSNFEMELSP